MSEPLKIDVWSDVACPWCYIGKRNLEAGIAAFSESPDSPSVEVEFHSFELSPDTPVEFAGSSVDFLVAHKRMPVAQVEQMLEFVTQRAAEAGLTYDFDSVQHTNTVKAHQLLHYAKARGLQHEAKERLMAAYFVEGRHVGRMADLADLAAEIGLDRDDVMRSLAEEEYLADVRADQRQAIDYGISGVPFFVIAGRYGVSGAQPPEAFTQVLSRVVSELDAPVAP